MQVRWNTQAILGFVFLLVGITVAAIPFAHVALAKLKTTGERGRPLAIVTLVLAYPLFALVMTLFITSIVIAATGGAG
ncbi:hypothetical protein GCM10007382_19600 [Salinibacterium xinjiangense]|nr:hypothetical protein GCM10007382_19600 [Salinibacterium xinjiangense]